jgi:hypothetical protein
VRVRDNAMNNQNHYDLPFLYTFDTDNLADGQNYLDVALPMVDNADFIFRRVVGVRNVVDIPANGGLWQWRDSKRQDRASGPYQPLQEELIIPEVMFSYGAELSLDLYASLRANRPYAVPGSVPNYLSQLAFQGVKRYWGGGGMETQYRYRTMDYTITENVQINWAGRIAPAYILPENPRQFSVRVDDYDFNLQAVGLFMQTALAAAPVVSDGFVKIMLYGPRQEQLSLTPVLDSYVVPQNGAFNNVFPAPTIVYPAGSILRFDITSLLLDTEVPGVLTVNLIGERRIPC